jgi:hypothetical protein
MKLNTLPFIRHFGMTIGFACLSFFALAQSDQPDISKMGHFKLRSYLKDNGFKTQSGHVVKVGDTLWVGKGTMPNKTFAFIYQDQTSPVSKTSWDGSTKGYLNSSATGRRAIVKNFMTSGMRKGEYSIFTVVGVAEPVNYWVELDAAIEAGEISLTKTKQ